MYVHLTGTVISVSHMFLLCSLQVWSQTAFYHSLSNGSVSWRFGYMDGFAAAAAAAVTSDIQKSRKRNPEKVKMSRRLVTVSGHTWHLSHSRWSFQI